MTPVEPGRGTLPIQLDIHPPTTYDPKQLLLRLLVCTGVVLVHQSWGRLFFALYLLLPAAAFVLIARSHGDALADHDRARLERFVGWIISFYGFMMFVADKFPLEEETRDVRFSVREPGHAGSKTALLRLFKALPHVIFVGVMLVLSALTSLWLSCCLLIGWRFSAKLSAFQRSVLARFAHVLAYLAALTDVEPPIGLRVEVPDALAGDSQVSE